MDLFYLGRQLITSLPTGNGTDVSTLHIRLLETVVPGYSLFVNTVQQWLGFDISFLMICIAFFFIAKRAVDFVWDRAYETFKAHFTSSIHIDGTDELYTTVLEWISVTRPDLSKRSLTARTQYGNQYDSDDDSDDEDADMLARIAIGDNGYYNFSKTAARVPPRYEPDFGRFWFMSPRGTFEFQKRTLMMRATDGTDRSESSIHLSCIGLSTNSIKLLLADIKDWTVRKEGQKTVIRVPCSDRWNGWMRSSERPSRPLDTVILDPEQKSRILRDMNEYLHPLSPKWYASRGIPYRRGYLFHGPPGTGKTSLSFSLAGIFGLDIHIVNLMDPSMNESMLSRLFTNLPRRCIVLFEDIDAAGIKKREDESDATSDSDSDSESEVEESVSRSSNQDRREGRRCVAAGERRSSRASSKTTSRDAFGTNGKVNGVSSQRPRSGTTNFCENDTNGCHVGSVALTNGDGVNHNSHGDNCSPCDASDCESDLDTSPSRSSRSSRHRKHSRLTVSSLARALIAASRRARSPSSSPSPSPDRRRRKRKSKSKNKSGSSDSDNEPTCKISLSGLLNVIDGVATHEGRILIMTTNHPEKLDPALVRAGRVDMQVAFTNATKPQIKSLFLRMYAADHLPTATSTSSSLNKSHGSGAELVKEDDKMAIKAGDMEEPLAADELEALSTRFSEELPEGKFAPSDVQGYLLLHRKKPREAVDSVADWRDAKLAETTDKEQDKTKAVKKAKTT